MVDWRIVLVALLAGCLLAGAVRWGRWWLLLPVPVLFWWAWPTPPLAMLITEAEQETAVTPLLPPPAIATTPPLLLEEGVAQVQETAVVPTLPPALALPTLGITRSIVPLPLLADSWDVSQLGGDVGWLTGTGQTPTDDHPIVLAGHLTYPDSDLLAQGAFSNLQALRLGDEVRYRQGGAWHNYRVVQVFRVGVDEVDVLQEGNGRLLLLLTCTDWNTLSRTYDNRLIVRAEYDMSP